MTLMQLHRNTDCDYSSAYVEIKTDSDLVGYGMTFTIGRGNDIVRGSHRYMHLKLTSSRYAWP